MNEKRFIGSCAGFYDKYKKNRWLWSEWEEITTILNNLNEKSVERSKALSKLQKENEQLKKEIQRLKLIINGLNYALKNIRQIDVEIDLNECGDVE